MVKSHPYAPRIRSIRTQQSDAPMGKLIAFGPLDPSMSSRDIAAMFDRTTAADREAVRRMKVYGCWNVSADLLRILALYPEFRLTHAKKVRSCIGCGANIAPGSLHFVKDGSYLCQRGTCLDELKPSANRQ